MNNIKNPSPNVMNTWTGRQFDPLHMQPSDVSLEDIAHALSLLCRGGGHLDRFYSVGQHCINCAGEARARGWSDRLVLACLLHDASEAYISDIIRPVKIHLDNYREIEDRIMSVILIAFGLHDLTPAENTAWKQIDDDMLRGELREMIVSTHDLPPIPLAAVPDFTEHPHQEIEAAFLLEAGQLLDLLRQTTSANE